MTKQEIRSAVKDSLRRKPESVRTAQSLSVCRAVASSRVWQDARNVMLYMPLGDEVDLRCLLDTPGKTFYVPRVCGDDIQVCRYGGAAGMSAGSFGILEPEGEALTDISCLDLILVPGVAFTMDGGRLGRGRGYYDRFLAGCRCPSFGIAFPEQILEELPLEKHDIRLSGVFTTDR